mmetsp:Transcript_35181/g.45360  ORF Transcript_35181/g.45360 Transcript_35181/m.45360 type:complete len:299 (+) Transcript_35181:40-936(+)
MVDYTKWNTMDYDSDDNDQFQRVPPQPSSSPSSALTPELTQKLFEMKQDSPESLENLDKELEKLKQLAIKEKKEQANPSAQTTKALSSQKKVLLNKLDAMEQEKRHMDNQMKELEQLAAAGDPQSLLNFFEKQGMDRKDIQKMLGGSDHDSKEVLSTTVETVTKDKNEILTKDANNALDLIDSLDNVLNNDVPCTELPPPSSSSSTTTNDLKLEMSDNKKRKKKNQKNVILPEFYQKVVNQTNTNDINSEKQVIVVVELPELSSANEAKLDVSRRKFKLKGEPTKLSSSVAKEEKKRC